ncbi:MAG TPA: lipoyl synthase [Blastocatellia bacterium]|nr:lipoyl synthase [Blastocatellia bacterium]
MLTQIGPRLPDWLRKPWRDAQADHAVKRLMRERDLHTVCESARCPNRNECFSRGTATFMIGGNICTRHCAFCSVPAGRPESYDAIAGEPEQVADAAAEMGLQYVVVTAVARDDLADGGARHFARTIHALRDRLPDARVEVLTPDFGGSDEHVGIVVEAGPDVFNHNVETVRRLSPVVRSRSDHDRSLNVLKSAAGMNPSMLVKSGLMVGLGETTDEVHELLGELRDNGVHAVTIGQYLQPTRRNLPVVDYVHPDTYDEYRSYGESLGFDAVFAGPFVRSSYMAESVFEDHR